MSDTNPNKTYAVTKELSADERLREQARHREEALINERLALSAERTKTLSSVAAYFKAKGMSDEQIQEAIWEIQNMPTNDSQSPFQPESDEDEDEEMDFEP